MGSKRGLLGENSMIDLMNINMERLKQMNYSKRRSMMTKSPE